MKMQARFAALSSILLVHVLLLAIGALRTSPTYDEIQHVPAGVMHWETTRFNFGYTNPPLPRYIATFLLTFTEHASRWDNVVRDSAHGHSSIGRQYAEINGPGYLWQVRIARIASIVFSLSGASICYIWARQLYSSNRAALIALSLWCFCPFVLGHGQLATVDVASAAFGTFLCYRSWIWVKSAAWHDVIALGIAAGLACLAKFTWFVVLLMLPFLAMYQLTDRERGIGRCICQVSAAFALALFVINCGYGFDGSFQTVASYQEFGRLGFIPQSLGSLHMPLPHYYILGIETLRGFVESQPRSYLLGQWQHGGWPHYYAIGLCVKLTCGTLVLLVLRVVTKRTFSVIGDYPLVVGAFIFALVSSQTGVGHHLRYAMPALPLLFIWLSGFFSLKHHWVISRIASAAITCQIVSSLATFPHSLSYFNEFVGGPRSGPKYFLDSNIDWGQDLLQLGRWQRENLNAKSNMDLIYFGTMQPSLAGVRHIGSVNDDPEQIIVPPELLAISVNFLYGMKHSVHYRMRNELRHEAPIDSLRLLEPYDMAGYSIYIFSREQIETAKLVKKADEQGSEQ